MADVKILQNKDGSLWADLPGGQLQPVTEEQARLIVSNPGTVSNILGSAVETGKQALLGLASFGPDAELAQAPLQRSREETQARGMVSPISTMAGQAAPAVAVGAATMGAGALPTIGAEALYGAAMNPEAPVEGAAIGGAFGALPFAAQGARAAYGQGARMVDRVTGRLGQAEASVADATAEAGGRNLKGFLTPGEEGAAGLPLTQGDAAALRASAGQQTRAADQMRRAEELRSTDPLFGGSVRAVRDEQQGWLTNRVKQTIGLSGDSALTPAAVGDAFTNLGAKFDDFSKRTFPQTGINPASFDESLPLLQVRYGDMGLPPQVEKILANLMDKVDGQGSPVPISYVRWHDAGRELDNLAKTAKGRGNLEIMGAARDAKEAMLASLENLIGPAAKAEYAKLRKQYAILKTVAGRSSAIDASGQVNARSMQNALRSDRAPWKFKVAGDDPFMRAVDTVAYLQTKVVPSSGTAERLLANPGRTAVSGAQALGLGGAGMLGYDQVFGR